MPFFRNKSNHYLRLFCYRTHFLKIYLGIEIEKKWVQVPLGVKSTCRFWNYKKNRVSAYNPVNTFDAKAKSNFVFELKWYVMKFKCLLFVLCRFFRKGTTLMTALVLPQYPKVQNILKSKWFVSLNCFRNYKEFKLFPFW